MFGAWRLEISPVLFEDDQNSLMSLQIALVDGAICTVHGACNQVFHVTCVTIMEVHETLNIKGVFAKVILLEFTLGVVDGVADSSFLALQAEGSEGIPICFEGFTGFRLYGAEQGTEISDQIVFSRSGSHDGSFV
jgi:hypothetical protein